VVGLFAVGLLSVQMLASDLGPMPELAKLPPWARPVGISIDIAAFLFFGLAFWWNTRPVQTAAVSRLSFVFLGLQSLIAVIIWTDLLLIVAAEVPFVLHRRAATLWMAGLSAGLVMMGLLMSSSSGFVPLHGTDYLPRPVAVGLTMFSALAWAWCVFSAGYAAVSQERERQELARVNAELLATQSLLAESSRLAERLQIARELHDTLGHHLTVLNVNLELSKRLTEGRAAEPIGEAQAVTRLLLSDVREVVSALREDRTLDLRHALATLASGTPEPRIHLALAEDLEVEDPAQAHALFRCVQEVITNAVRHSRARNLWIEVTAEEGGLALRARDDGRGTAKVKLGNGLRGMRERLEEAGGRLEIESRPGRGFSIAALLPSPAETA
jgi:signal transduction histidine kinase